MDIIKKKKCKSNIISIIGILDKEKINSLIINLNEMILALEFQANNLIFEVDNAISTQSQIIDHNCLIEIEESISKITSSISDTSLNMVKDTLSVMEDKIQSLESEIRGSNIDKFNNIYEDDVAKTKFIDELKSVSTSAAILFNGDSLRQEILDLFVVQDSDVLNYEKDKMISMAITYLDLAVKKYDNYITKIQKMIDVIENAKVIKLSCELSRELIFSYGKDSLIVKTPEELDSIIELKLKGVDIL